MLIPYSNNNTYNVGDTVIFTKELDIGFCIITLGHKAKIIEKVIDRGYDRYNLIDSDNNIFEKIDSDFFTLVYSYSEAKELKSDFDTEIEIKRICMKHCHHKTIKRKSWSRWDDYIACELLKNEKIDTCEPNISCLKYINNDEVFIDGVLPQNIKKYIRKQKIKKLL